MVKITVNNLSTQIISKHIFDRVPCLNEVIVMNAGALEAKAFQVIEVQWLIEENNEETNTIIHIRDISLNK